MTYNHSAMKTSLKYMIVLLAGLFFSVVMSAQQLEVEDGISQSNLPSRNANYKKIQSQQLVSTQTTSVGPLSKGYRGMIETAHGFDWCKRLYYAFEFSTTHGYQFNPYLYLGGVISFGRGTSRQYTRYLGYDYYYQPGFNFNIGSDLRVYMAKGNLAPFMGLQFGFDLCVDNCFILLKGQLGLRYAINNNWGLNFGVQVGPSCYFESGEILFKLGVEF